MTIEASCAYMSACIAIAERASALSEENLVNQPEQHPKLLQHGSRDHKSAPAISKGVERLEELRRVLNVKAGAVWPARPAGFHLPIRDWAPMTRSA